MKQDYNRAMDQLHLPPQAEQRILTALESRAKQPKKRNWRIGAALAVAAVLMTGSAFAVAYRSGVLEAFFHGDTSQVEPYVQTAVGSAENHDYRLTVDSTVCDSQTLYAVITVEGLNDQAVEDLKSNQVIAESHREVWGQEMVDSLMANGSAGPDTFWAAFADSGTHVSGIQYQGLTAPSDTSRSWQVKISLMDADHKMGTGPVLFWLGFMGKEYAVEIPTDTAMETIQLTIDRDVQPEYPGGPTVFVQSLELSPTSIAYVGTYWDEQRDADNPAAIFFRMKDGQILTRMQLGYTFLDHASRIKDLADPLYRVHYQTDTPVDLDQVASIILGDVEFPLDGSAPSPADVPENLYPFTCTEIIPGENHFFRFPVEELCQKLGADYQWDESTQTATATYRGVTLTMTVGESCYQVNGETVELSYEVRSDPISPDSDYKVYPQYISLEDDVLTAPVNVLDHWSLDYPPLKDTDGNLAGMMLVIP